MEEKDLYFCNNQNIFLHTTNTIVSKILIVIIGIFNLYKK